MRWLIALLTIFSLWIYGIYLFCTEGRTQPASWNSFYRRMRGIGKGAWQEVRYQGRELYKDTKGILKDTKRGVKDVLGMTKTKDQDYYEHKASKRLREAEKAQIKAEAYVTAGSHQL